MTQALALLPEITPAQFEQQIETAKAKAKTLAALVEAAKLSVQIGPSKHLRVEAWETIGRAYGLTAGAGDTVILENGVRATAYVYDGTGTIIGRADGYCFREEPQWAEKPLAQLAGMAQTRAVSRALRQILAWVVVLAGYSATPAEEMEAEVGLRDRGYGICGEHKAAWFKTDKMRGPAHPIGDGTWCNRPKNWQPPVDVASPQEEPLSPDAPEAPQEATDDGEEAEEAQGQPIANLGEYWALVKGRWPRLVSQKVILDKLGVGSLKALVDQGWTLDEIWADTQKKMTEV